MYIARKIMTVNGEQRMPGDPVPEASGWLRVESYVRSGRIEWVDDPEPVAEEPKPKPRPAKKAAAKPEPSE